MEKGVKRVINSPRTLADISNPWRELHENVTHRELLAMAKAVDLRNNHRVIRDTPERFEIAPIDPNKIYLWPI